MIKLSIETKSYLLSGSGEGSILIDADVVYHKNGFPFIPARRVKGLLRESLQEVMEIEGKDDLITEKTLDDLFGKQGDAVNNGKLIIHNFYLENWEIIKLGLIEAIDQYPLAFQPELIRQNYTSEIQQTAIDPEAGVAKKRSLRNYRVLNPELLFIGTLATSKIEPDLYGLLEKAVLNLRYAGTRRNRGFGKVECKLIKDGSNVAVKGSGNDIQITGNKISVKMKTLSPVVLALQLGDQNTVFTESHISGSRLRGLLASLYIQKNSLTQPEKDPCFRKLFLSEAIKFGALRFENAEPIPLNIHTVKKNAKSPGYDVFNSNTTLDEKSSLLKDEITKPVKGSGLWENEEIKKLEPSTTFYFHNTRMNRAAGKSTDDDKTGGIFYYESIDEDQEFSGLISGNSEDLKELVKAFGNNLLAGIGRSKSVQYGQVEVEFSNYNKDKTPESSFKSGAKQEVLFICQTPLIFLNEFGFPNPNGKELKKALEEATGAKVNHITNVAASIVMIEQYNSVWKAKSGKIAAFAEGSVFLINMYLTNDATERLLTLSDEGFGEWRNQGFGKIRVMPYKDFPTQFKIAEAEKKTYAVSKGSNFKLSNSELIKILGTYKKEEQRVIIRSRAIEKVQGNFKVLNEKLKNHLIGRLEAVINEKKSKSELAKWLESIKGKPADEALIKARLKKDLEGFDTMVDIIDKQNDIDRFELAQIYWLTFFQTLRKMKKAHERQSDKK